MGRSTDTRRSADGRTHRRIRRSLARATATLVGVTTPLAATISVAAEPWDINLGLMSYLEQDRNTGLEFLLDARRLLANDNELKLGVELDTLTGATPNGATASNTVQTFTRSSGAGSYTSKAGELPADDTHEDTRLAVSAGYQQQLGNQWQIDYDGKISMEFDYLSFGLANAYQYDFNQNNSSLYVGVNAEYNRVHPVGNIPDALSLMTPEDTEQNRNQAASTRTVLQAALGWTQVIDTKSLMQIRVTRSHLEGYLNDPYKLLSMINTDDSDPEIELGSTLAYRFEKRPRIRDTDTVFLEYKRHLEASIATVSARHSQDTWDVTADTLELRWRKLLSTGNWIEPHVRWYRQSAADFFYHSLSAESELPAFASADLRLGEYQAVTVGLSVGMNLGGDSALQLSAAYYEQNGESNPDTAVGLQQEQDLFPTLKVGIFRMIYSVRW
ncbi:MAG: DUF3570 domain-containing protein [Gammaproteobacteria bacterium]|nr:DUF3570 domain-containing protein [Gammaproteobacteria bacterium]